MDGSSSSSRNTRQRKFTPRPPRLFRRPTGPPPATDADGEERAAQMIASNYAIGQGKPKAEKKASAQVAFQPSLTPLPIEPVAVTKEDDGRCSNSDLKTSSPANVLPTISSVTGQNDAEKTFALVDGDASVPKAEKDYVEPWDPCNRYSPITLPLRKPPIGDPELRDKEEFGEVAGFPDYDENTINSAKELGLTPEERGKEKKFFIQLPGLLPVKKQLTDANNEDNLQRSSAFDGLQGGFMGKMSVYKSGAVKLKLGDILFDVSPGPNTNFQSDVVKINTKEKEFCVLRGSIDKMVTITPDIDSLLDSERTSKPTDEK